MATSAQSHRPPGPKRPVAARLTTAQRGYGGAWQRLRLQHLADHPYCVECYREGRVVPATDVDHKAPHRGGPPLLLDPDNLQSLCHAHHSAKTAREDGGFGRKPKDN